MIQIIPAIDLIDGKCVRLTRGDFDQSTVYSDNPLEMAKQFEAAGMERLHIVDLDGAKTGRPANLNILESIANGTALKIDFGGGIKSERCVDAVFSAGAAMVNIGSLAVKEPEIFMSWVEKYGGDTILLGADTRNGKVAINGWQTDTDVAILDLLNNYAERGVTSVFVTDIEYDGAMAGPSIELYRQIVKSISDIRLIASGGVRSIEDIEELDQIGCAGVIIGKAIYEGRINLANLEKYAG